MIRVDQRHQTLRYLSLLLDLVDDGIEDLDEPELRSLSEDQRRCKGDDRVVGLRRNSVLV